MASMRTRITERSAFHVFERHSKEMGFLGLDCSSRMAPFFSLHTAKILKLLRSALSGHIAINIRLVISAGVVDWRRRWTVINVTKSKSQGLLYSILSDGPRFWRLSWICTFLKRCGTLSGTTRRGRKRSIYIMAKCRLHIRCTKEAVHKRLWSWDAQNRATQEKGIVLWRHWKNVEAQVQKFAATKRPLGGILHGISSHGEIFQVKKARLCRLQSDCVGLCQVFGLLRVAVHALLREDFFSGITFREGPRD